MSKDLKYFIEDNIDSINKSDWGSLFEDALFELYDNDRDFLQLVDIVENLLHGELKAPIGDYDLIIKCGIEECLDKLNEILSKYKKSFKLKKPITNKEIAEVLSYDTYNEYLKNDVLPDYNDKNFEDFQHHSLEFSPECESINEGGIRIYITWGCQDIASAPLYIDSEYYRFIADDNNSLIMMFLNIKDITATLNSYINDFKEYI